MGSRRRCSAMKFLSNSLSAPMRCPLGCKEYLKLCCYHCDRHENHKRLTSHRLLFEKQGSTYLRQCSTKSVVIARGSTNGRVVSRDVAHRQRQRLGGWVRCQAITDQGVSERAEEGDIVKIHFTVYGEQNEKLESTREAGQPLTFEVGSSDIINNELLAAFDAGIRGLTQGKHTHVLIAVS